MHRVISFILCWLFTSVSYASDQLTLRLLTWEGYAPAAQVEEFVSRMKDKYAVSLQLQVSYVASSDDYFSAIRGNTVDIIAPSHSVFNDSRYKFLQRQLILPLNLNNIPNHQKLLSRLKQLNYSVTDQQAYFVPLTFGTYGLAYNKDNLSAAPTSWLDLWQSRYAGRYTINSDYYEANIYITALASGLNYSDIQDINKLNTPRVKSMLNQLVVNASKLWGGVDSARDLSNHDLATSWGFSFPALKQQGEHWQMACPLEGTTVWIDGHSLSRTLENRPLHKLIAEEWINFTLEDEVQRNAVARDLNSLPATENIFSELQASGKLPHDPECINFDLKWPELTPLQRNFMKSIWKQALKAREAAARI